MNRMPNVYFAWIKYSTRGTWHKAQNTKLHLNYIYIVRIHMIFETADFRYNFDSLFCQQHHVISFTNPIFTYSEIHWTMFKLHSI